LKITRKLWLFSLLLPTFAGGFVGVIVLGTGSPHLVSDRLRGLVAADGLAGDQDQALQKKHATGPMAGGGIW
jgi:hypothetical protein